MNPGATVTVSRMSGCGEQVQAFPLPVGLVISAVGDAQVDIADAAGQIIIAPIGYDQFAAGFQDACHFLNRRHRVGDVVKHVAGDHHIEGFVGPRQGIRIPDAKFGALRELLLRNCEHFRHRVNSRQNRLRILPGDPGKQFTGAAAELRQAYLCNPHHTDGVKEAIEQALGQTPDEGKRRMRAMRRQLRTHDVQTWARDYLSELRSVSP